MKIKKKNIIFYSPEAFEQIISTKTEHFSISSELQIE